MLEQKESLEEEEIIEEEEEKEEKEEFRAERWPVDQICKCAEKDRTGIIISCPITQEEIAENLIHNEISIDEFESIPQISVFFAYCQTCQQFSKIDAFMEKVFGKVCFDCGKGVTGLSDPIVENYCEIQKTLIMQHIGCRKKQIKIKKEKKEKLDKIKKAEKLKKSKKERKKLKRLNKRNNRKT